MQYPKTTKHLATVVNNDGSIDVGTGYSDIPSIIHPIQ